MDEEGQIIVSKDGKRIWAQALGTPSKPAVVFIHGFGCTAAAFDKQFSDPEMLSNIYMVRFLCPRYGFFKY
jgi:pimeloyl-ACP methyl ester carboxylesterase